MRVFRKVFDKQCCFIRCRRPREPRFWAVIDSFVLLAYVILAASKTLLERLQVWTLLSNQIYSVGKNGSDFYEQWQQNRQLKSMEMREGWPDTYDEGYIMGWSRQPHLCQMKKHKKPCIITKIIDTKKDRHLMKQSQSKT